MTVSYQSAVGSVGLLGGFTSLLFRWRGSLYKLCYRELLCFVVPFCILSAFYRRVFTEDQRRLFEMLVKYFDRYLNMIPLSFILGFYVTIVAQRWWQQLMSLPWPDRLLLAVVMYVPGTDPKSRLLRHTLLRQCNLMVLLLLRTLSDSVRNRFKTLQEVVDAGFMTSEEMKYFESVKTGVNTFWVPSLWFTHNLREAIQNQGTIDAHGVKLIMEQLLDFRAKCSILWNYGWVTVPLVYTQVVTLATYSFFIACIIGRQQIDDGSCKELNADVYFPAWTVLQFLFYMGLLKVAEQMINPYGDDDEDFELNSLLDRHAEVIELGTNLLFGQCPPILKDPPFYNSSFSLNKRKFKRAVKRKYDIPSESGEEYFSGNDINISATEEGDSLSFINQVAMINLNANIAEALPDGFSDAQESSAGEVCDKIQKYFLQRSARRISPERPIKC